MMEKFFNVLEKRYNIQTRKLHRIKQHIISFNNNNNNNNNINNSIVCSKCQKSDGELKLRQSNQLSRLSDEIISCDIICETCSANF